MVSELLQKVRVIDPVSNTDKILDVLIIDGYIQNIAPEIPPPDANVNIRNCQGLVLGTGLVDLYSHSGEPGFEERETLTSLLQAATAGGFTRVTVLPDTFPVIDHPAVVKQLQTSPHTSTSLRASHPTLRLRSEQVTPSPPVGGDNFGFSRSRIDGICRFSYIRGSWVY